jgi:hypothetical protein
MMDRWLKTGSFTKSNEKLDEQSIASSTSVPDLEPIQVAILKVVVSYRLARLKAMKK